MITVSDYRDADNDELVRRPDDDWGADGNAMRVMAASSPTKTVRLDGKVVMIFGVWKLWEGCWEAWAVTSDDVRGYGHSVVRATKNFLEDIALRTDVKRFQALSREDKPEYTRFLTMLGFELEYVSKQAYDGKLDIIGLRRLA